MNGTFIGSTAKRQDIFYPGTPPSLVAVSGIMSYLSWEGYTLDNQWVVRLDNTPALMTVQKAYGKWADRATLTYQYI